MSDVQRHDVSPAGQASTALAGVRHVLSQDPKSPGLNTRRKRQDAEDIAETPVKAAKNNTAGRMVNSEKVWWRG